MSCDTQKYTMLSIPTHSCQASDVSAVSVLSLSLWSVLDRRIRSPFARVDGLHEDEGQLCALWSLISASFRAALILRPAEGAKGGLCDQVSRPSRGIEQKLWLLAIGEREPLSAA
mmetsp:Transcript_61258/g.136428  ORF Transcript_61258/g.136428 Transcript_61258/m.136428 type:complete len:115 (-) Transcript_61258:4-348(-)